MGSLIEELKRREAAAQAEADRLRTLAKLAALESARSSFESARDVIAPPGGRAGA
jgi:hypothetical protein